MKFFYKTLFPLYALVFAPIFPSLMFEMCENYVHSSAQTLNFSNETIMMMEPSTDVHFVGEMEPTVSPSFEPHMVSTQSVDLGHCMKTFAQQEVEPAIISLASGLFDASSTGFELIRKHVEAFINDLPAFDLFDVMNTKFEHIYEMIQVNDLFDIIATTFERFHQNFSDHYEVMDTTIRTKYEELFSESYEVLVKSFPDPYDIFDHGVIHFSSAPMVTGNLTGSAINLGRINDDSMLELIPTTGCTIPVFSLDFILELTDQEIFIKSGSKQDGNLGSSFILESLARSWAVLESIVSSVFDRISLGYQQVSEKLESLYKQHFAPTTTPPPSSWVGELVITACKKWAVLESIASSVLDRISLGYQQVSEKLESLYKQHFAPTTTTPPSSWVGERVITACKKWAVLESIVSSVLDKISLWYQQVSEKLASLYKQHFAPATPPAPSSWVRQLVITACKKLGAFVTDFFAPPPPPRNFQLIARKFLSTIRFANMLIWHAINRNRGGIQ